MQSEDHLADGGTTAVLGGQGRTALPPLDGYRVADVAGTRTFALWCKGCRCIHHVPIDGSRGWAWDDAAQTLTPSVKHWYSRHAEAVRHSAPHDVTTCHYFVKSGQIEYLGDCQHALRGLHPLDEAPPENYGGREHFGWITADSSTAGPTA